MKQHSFPFKLTGQLDPERSRCLISIYHPIKRKFKNVNVKNEKVLQI